MALERDPAHLGNIGDDEPEPKPDPDRIYERGIELQRESREE